MRQIMEAMTAMLFILILSITGIELITAQIEAERARQYRVTVARVIEQSDYNEEAMTKCMDLAKEEGYRLKIEFLQETGECVVWTDDKRPGLTNVYMAMIELTFEMRIPVIHSSIEHTLYATAG